MTNANVHQTLSILSYPEHSNLTHSASVSGSKNCALPVIMYSFLYHGKHPITIKNVPNIIDVQHVLTLLKSMGGSYTYDPTTNDLVIIHGITTSDIPLEILKKTRISVLLMSILLIKDGEVFFPKKLGGCNLGERKYDFHLQAFESMGCTIIETDENYHIQHTLKKEKALVAFPKETTTGTENALFFASHKTKETRIKRGHLRPEILELISFMNLLGCQITIDDEDILVHGTNTHEVAENVSFSIIDDMEEALSLVTLAYATDIALDISFNNPHYYRELELLSVLGSGSFIRDYRVLHVRPFQKQLTKDRIDITTQPYPLIGSDSQPILAALLLKLSKSFSIKETRFEDRFSYTTYFDLFRINFTLSENTLQVQSPDTSSTSNTTDDHIYSLEAYDLRAGMNAVLVSTMLKKRINLHNSNMLLRGYTNFYDTLKRLGFKIELS